MVINKETIRSIINSILDKDKTDIDILKNTILDLIEESTDYIIEYSSVLLILKEIDQSEEYEVLDLRIKPLKENLIENGLRTESEKSMYKILEYISLEIPRINDVKQLEKFKELANGQLQETRKKNRTFTKQIDDYREKVNRTQSEFISIMSIFSAVIIAFFSGSNLLGNSLESIDKANKFKLITIILIIGIVMFNVIYMLLYTVSKITEKKISSDKKDYSKCQNCEQRDASCYIKEYPLPIYYNLCTVYGLINISIMYYFDKFNLLSKWTNSNGFLVIIIYGIAITISISVFIAICFFIQSISSCNIPECGKSTFDQTKASNNSISQSINSMIGIKGIVDIIKKEELVDSEKKNKKD
ncbi:MAG: hypothetical protein ACRCVJ_12155 [Clostridium sp.]|uniref:hypothetical protein n=1 Tax=Clostridium sp. TaxID=1506 RepID=UPI003F3C6667